MPPHLSIHNQLLEEINSTTMKVVTALYDHVMTNSNSSSDSDMMSLSPPSPLSPYLSDSTGSNSSNSSDVVVHYSHLLGAISALHDEVEASDVFNQPNHPIPQLKFSF
ncbi:hypothetical protein BDR04DRAFT_1152590 [Suillus decipiens]|nr:hypothetical protein BDR04DRAFT_1152590 [Suillus decipiens]